MVVFCVAQMMNLERTGFAAIIVRDGFILHAIVVRSLELLKSMQQATVDVLTIAHDAQMH